MDLELQGQVAVVTGASKGIGLAIVEALVREGVHVIAGARTSSARLDELAGTGAVQAVQVDLADPGGPGALVARAGSQLDILVNNVGNAPSRTAGIVEVTDEQWLASLNLNFLAAVRATRAAVPVMLAAGRGSIVTMASVNSVLPDPLVIDYSAAKAALANFCKGLSKEVGPRGIRVNTVSPGPVSTDLWLGPDGAAAARGRASGVQPADVAAAAAGQSVTGRFSRPDEVADLVVLLASGRTANMTGANLTLDGGLIPTL